MLLSRLGEWCIKLPLLSLTQVQEDGRSLLHHVFSALLTGVKSAPGSPASTLNSPINGVHQLDGFDPDIHVDNLKEAFASPGRSGVGSKSRSADPAQRCIFW